MLSSGPTGRGEPLQMEDSNMDQGAEDVEPGMPDSPGHLTGRCKNYPLRKRSLVPEKPKACKVLLTRLENVAGPRSADEADELPPDLPKPPSPTPSSEDTGLVQPRKRRLASLNAEALNNLLLEREDTSRLAGARRSRGGGGTLTGAVTGPQGPGLSLSSDLGWETLEREVGTCPQSQLQMKVPVEMETQLPRDWLA